MIPLRCDIPRKGFPAGTVFIVILCCALFALRGRTHFFSTGFVPLDFFHAILHPGAETMVSATRLAGAFFIHATIVHLVSNMWFLFIFGSAVEYRLGILRFCAAYVSCGALSMLAQALYAPLSPVPIVGASGAIAGIMGIHFVLQPFSKIVIWVPPLFFVRVWAFVFLLFWFYVQYVNAGGETGAHVAWWAHIGGFLVGSMWGTIVRIKSMGDRKTSGNKR